jgi:gas vesicle protein
MAWSANRSHTNEGVSAMKFIVGLLTGLVLGAAGAVIYSVQSGRDLREAYEQVRSDLDNRDFEALGSRIEAGFAQMQAQIEEKIGQARDTAASTADQVTDAAQRTAEDAADAVPTEVTTSSNGA